MELGDERHDRAVDLAPDAGVTDIGVHGISEIYGGRTARQGDQPSARGKAEDLILKQFELGVLDKFLGVLAFGQMRDGGAQPVIGLALRLELVHVARDGFLVELVRGDAEFGDGVHFMVRICSSTRWRPADDVVWMER